MVLHAGTKIYSDDVQTRWVKGKVGPGADTYLQYLRPLHSVNKLPPPFAESKADPLFYKIIDSGNAVVPPFDTGCFVYCLYLLQGLKETPCPVENIIHQEHPPLSSPASINRRYRK